MLRLRGGAKKRKKKVYTTPKKIKHKRKKTKLAVLKYYKVDGDGKIERLRRECPTPEVGCLYETVVADVLMIQHSAEPVSSWLLCTTASTVANAILPTFLIVRWRRNYWYMFHRIGPQAPKYH